MSEYRITADDVADLMDCIGAESESAIRLDYSGRGMNGRECFGVVTDVNEAQTVFAVARVLSNFHMDPMNKDYFIETMDELSQEYRTDSMGRSTILYWPDVTVTVEDE